MTDYLKIPEVARRLDVSEPTVRRMVKSGKLPSVFVGGAYRVSEEDLDEYLRNAKVVPVAAHPKERSYLSAERALEIADNDFRRAVEDAPTPELQQTALELADFTEVQTREDLVRNKDNKEAHRRAHRRVVANQRIGVINSVLYGRGDSSPVELVARRLDEAMTAPDTHHVQESRDTA